MLEDKHHIFAAVVTAGSISKAAENLNCCRKYVSSVVEDLERISGVQLLERLSSGIKLTDPGRSVFATCIAIQRLIREEEEKLSNWSQQKRQIKIISTTGLSSLWLSSILSGFRAQYPEVQIELYGVDEQIDLRRNEADLFIRPTYIDLPDFNANHLLKCKTMLYASPCYIENRGYIHNTEELGRHDFISYGEEKYRPYENIDWYIELSGKRPVATINHSFGAGVVASDGLGIISWPDPIPMPKQFNLTRISEKVCGPEIDIYAYYKPESDKVLLVSLFMKYLKENIKGIYNEHICEKRISC